MIYKHNTAEGKTMFVSQMGDDHLVNTIRLFCKKIEECVAIIRNGEMSDNSIFYGIDTADLKHQAKARLEGLSRHVGNYACEAALRNIDVSQYLQKAFSRTGQEKAIGINGFQSDEIIMVEWDESIVEGDE